MANFDNNFWLENAGIQYHSVFNVMYEKDKSVDKKKSSKIMWAIFMLVHPSSPLYNDPGKEATIIKTFIKDPKFKWQSVQDEIYAYKDCSLTSAEKSLQNWNELMQLRDKSLKSLYVETLDKKDFKALESLDKMIANTAKLFADYAKIKKDYEEEKTTMKGKTVKSLSDSDEI